MSRSSKDLAKRLPFRHFPRGDTFRRYYLWAALVAVVVAGGVWLLMGRALGPRQYMPRPVSSVHATLSDRCENCHDSFQVVQDARCLVCHAARAHSEHEDDTPPCRSCHVEHLEGQRLTDVSSGACVECHAALESRRPGGPEIAAEIRTFADHPEFSPLRSGPSEGAGGRGPQGPRAPRPQGHDPTRLRFNHKLHLTSSEITEPLECVNCHQPEADGGHMTTALFERYASRPGEEAAVWPDGEDLSPGPFPRGEGEGGRDMTGEGPRMIYCRKCHAQKVKEVPSLFGDVEAPHARPDVIHQALVRDVLALGVQRAQTVFESDQVRLPGRVPRMAVDSESKTWAEFQDRWVGAIESELYHPLRAAPTGGSLFENNKYCFLCHEQSGEDEDVEVSIAPPSIPSRWLPAAEFSHQAHEKMECAECHGDLKQSSDTADANLPQREVCEQCHREDAERSAGTQCVLCHLYHDISKGGAKSHPHRTLPMDVLTGLTAAKGE